MASPYGHIQVVNVGDYVKVRIREVAQYVIKAASTANIADLSAASNSIDGVTCADGDIVLLKDQSTGSQNGPYAFSGISGGSGVLTRVPPITSDLEVFPGLEFWVESGTANGGNAFKLATAGAIVVGTTSLSFVKLDDGLGASLAATTASNGASLVGIQDTGNYYAATTVEGALQEVRADLAAVTNGNGASLIGIEDAGTLYTAANVEAALAEVKALADAAPSFQVAAGTLVAGTVTINAGITITADSEVIPILIGAITGSANFGCLRELKASRVNGAPGVGTIVLEAVGADGAKDVDAAGAIRAVILTPQ